MKSSIVTLALLLCLPVGYSARPQTSSPLPQVVQHADPTYPPLARQTRISGDVHVEITTDGESVISAAAIDGHPLLRPSAEDNVRTWKFARHKPSTFSVTFRYKLDDGVNVDFLEVPGVVRIGGTAPTITDVGGGASFDFGVWKLEGESRLGKFERILDMSYPGLNEDGWLEGRLFADVSALRKAYAFNVESDDEEELESTDYGHKEANFVAFIVKLRRSKGRTTPVFFLGIVKGKKITGTFTESSGETGTWTATRLVDFKRRAHE
jgi:Gram-negative bacterial TonB protein C-terminal